MGWEGRCCRGDVVVRKEQMKGRKERSGNVKVEGRERK
jgi:hypothetical protein